MTVTEARVRAFGELSGDTNPIHMEEDAARRAGFRKRVAHGALLLAEVSRIIGRELPGEGSLWMSAEVDFRAAVYIGDELSLEARVEHVTPAFGIVALSIRAFRAADRVEVLRVHAKVKTVDEQMPLSFTPIDQQRVLVSGASRGLGKTITTRLLAAGAKVIGLYRGTPPDLDEVVGDAGSGARDRLVVRKCDVSRSDDVAHLFEYLGDDPLHGFVHAASPRVEEVPIEKLEWESVQPYIETVVKGGFEIVRRSLPYFEKTGTGRVILIGSEAVHDPRPGWGHYVTAKSALLGMARSLAVELAPLGATVNVVSPGAVHTSDLFPATVKAIVKNQTPLRRLVTEEEIAEVVEFLLEAGGSFITGSNIPMTGGRIFLS
jgi:3-oxoacyl-[acyl-carrier protein] reductase